jgi:hypothetical protein
MKTDPIRIAASSGVGASLFGLFFVFLARYAAVADWSSLTEIETAILVTMILRALILAVLGLKYELQPIVPIIVFSIEALLIPPLLVLIIIYGASYYAALMGVILTAWFGASALVLTPFTSFWFAKSLIKESSLTTVLVIGALEFTGSYFLAEILSGASGPVVGLSGLGTLIISQIRNDIGTGGIVAPGNQDVVSALVVIFFLSTLCYFTIATRPPDRKLKLPYVLTIPLIATLIAFVWVLGIAHFEQNILFVITAPAAVVILLLWGTARGN